MKDYGTLENYIRSYGGLVETTVPKTGSLGKDNKVTLIFSRPVIFPRNLIESFDPGY